MTLTASETPTASIRCQRWRDRRASWRTAHPGQRFDARHYEVHAIGETTAKRYVLSHHYSGSYPAASRRYGLYRAGRLVGVAVFSIPAQARVLAAVFPDLAPYTESLELGRLVLADECPGNSESWFLARCFGELLTAGIRGVVSFADPVQRLAGDGTVIAPGHVGWIYQACNARYTGRGTARTLTVLPDGTVLHDRAAQKVRSRDRGHEHVERRLVALGAPVPRAGQRPAEWLAAALDAVGARRIRHAGCHRYAFPLGAGRRARDRIRIGPVGRPYPKHADTAA